MRGLREGDPKRLRTVEELIRRVEEMGFLPLFSNTVPGFSVEEMTAARHWFGGDAERDPWVWRILAARSGRVAYGKFFDKKAGFLSLDWLPVFANWRRDGYDFDARYDDGKASLREKKIMELFETREELFSFEAKELAGFHKGGEKNFEGTVTRLQMQSYLVLKDFRCRKNKYGEDFGWHIAVLAPPEKIWGYELLSAAYSEEPERSGERIFERLHARFPGAAPGQLREILK